MVADATRCVPTMCTSQLSTNWTPYFRLSYLTGLVMLRNDNEKKRMGESAIRFLLLLGCRHLQMRNGTCKACCESYFDFCAGSPATMPFFNSKKALKAPIDTPLSG